MPSLLDISLYFLKIGAVCFGGPVALIERMRRELVDDKAWVSPRDFNQGLALSQLTPGPMATQLAIYIGFVRHGALGATLAGFGLVLPSFVMVVALASAYLRWQGLWWMQGLFYGVGAGVLSIIIRSAYRLTVRTLGRKRFLWILYAAMAILTLTTHRESVWLFIVCGLAAMMYFAAPKRISTALTAVTPVLSLWSPGGGLPPDWSLLSRVFLFFTGSSAFVYGGGLAIVPILYGGVVEKYHWLTQQQFVDAVAVAMITPGPVVITVGFIGYLVAGFAGASLAALGVFLPVFLLVLVLTPWYHRHGGNPQLSAFAEGVTAAAVGALSAAVLLIAPNAVHDAATAVIAAVTFALLMGTKIPEPVLVLISGAAGLWLFKP